MAGIQASLITPVEVAVAAATAKTVLQLIAPTSNHRLKVSGWGIFFDGVSATAAPAQVRVLRQTTTAAGTAVTPTNLGAGSETLQATGGYNATSEPTAGAEIDAVEVHPQSGYEKTFPMDVFIPGGGRMGIEVTAPAGVNCKAKFFYEE